MKDIWFTRTEDEENVVSLQNRMHQVTMELAEARKEIAYRISNAQVLNEQIECLKKINQLQDSEINNLRVRLDDSTSGGSKGGMVKVNQSNVPAQTALIERQAREVKELQDSIISHENIYNEAKYERKYKKALKKCERLKKEVQENIGYAQEMRQDFYENEREWEREREMEEYTEKGEKCDEEHKDVARSLAKKDVTIKKYEALLKKLNTKININEVLKGESRPKTNQDTTASQSSNQASSSQKTKTTSQKSQTKFKITPLNSLQQQPNPHQINTQQNPMTYTTYTMPPQQHIFSQHHIPPGQPMTMPPQTSMLPPQHMPHQQRMQQQQMPQQHMPQQQQQLAMPRKIMARPSTEPQVVIPQQQAVIPQQQRPTVKQQRPTMQQSPPTNLQWEVYVAPVSTSKKRRVSGTNKHQSISPKPNIGFYNQTSPQQVSPQQVNSTPQWPKFKPYSSSSEQLRSVNRPIVLPEDTKEETKN
ncbi:hypothetical protein INT48_006542 [Thamnidium elegans]|uniref:Uncharacterized protein n=1 Tax=Thamnidium elegans TaxID=101142 RepID=A0A8H7VUM9_9FUNG|nr:hypothetical protein INT48_006542 [Thamnidium elegans]